MPKVISEHSVLQRQTPIHIWGWSDPDEHIAVTLHGQTQTTEANSLGEWSLWLKPEQAGGPYSLSIQGATGSAPLVLNDILIGDVWLASGQSNMEMPLSGFKGSAVLKDADKEIASSDQPKIRLLRLGRRSSDFPLQDIDANWTSCTPETASQFSSIAYLFGREIQHDENVPIGLIDTTWGGTVISSWISLNALGADASLMPVFAERARFADEQTNIDQVKAFEERETKYDKQNHLPVKKYPWHPAQESYLPAGLYNAMIAPLTPYSVKGFLWYQGEADSAVWRAPLYSLEMRTLIQDWRAHWKQGALPFLYVQISSFHSPEENWGAVRDAQRRALSVDNTAMAVSLDVGQLDNVHPPDKQTVAMRLALAARAVAYHEKLEYSGPLFRQATVEDDKIRVWFDHAEGGLRTQSLVALPEVSATTFMKSFEVAGQDHKFEPAQAAIDGETVLVSSPHVPHPMFVRYAWSNESFGGIYNGDGLPAPTFSSE